MAAPNAQRTPDQAPARTNNEDGFAAFRTGFPALTAQTYFSVCDKMILHDRVRAGVDQFLDHLALASANRVGHETKVAGAREKFARLVNAPASAIAAARNVSDGVNSVAWALSMEEGDNVIVTAEAEHPNNIYPWLRQQRRGIEVRVVEPNQDGSLNVGRMIEAIDSRTKAMTCATVTFAPGHRADTRRLGEACRKNDVFFLVDGVQSAGILHHDLADEPIDGFATSTSKGLLGLYGFGFLYVSENWIDRMVPAYLSRPAVAMETDDHSAMGDRDYNLQPDSRRFEVGSYNLAGAYAADASLSLLLELGPQAIEDRVLRLSTRLNTGFADVDMASAVPAKGPGQSHIVTVGKLDAGGHGFSTDPKIEKISAHLTEARVTHTIRRGQLRFAIHAFNNGDDVDNAISAVADGLAKVG
jgi:cysteine desulfurase / selenocysteine lyase